MNKRQSIKLKYARINYNICDYNYIEDLASYLEEKIPKIKEFIEIDTVNECADITIYSNYDEFIRIVLKMYIWQKKTRKLDKLTIVISLILLKKLLEDKKSKVELWEI